MDFADDAKRSEEMYLHAALRARSVETCLMPGCSNPLQDDEEQETGVCDPCFWKIEGR